MADDFSFHFSHPFYFVFKIERNQTFEGEYNQYLKIWVDIQKLKN
jgi:hypothetical protein